jgi:lipopolysaccharide export system ATP-binding protein
MTNHTIIIMRLKAQKLVKSYRKKEVVRDVSVEVDSGEIVGLLGPNGAGKTTTFGMVVGLIRPDGGKIYLDDREVTQMPMHMRARSGIGYLPQESSVFRGLTVAENIAAILETLRLSKRERKRRLCELMADFRIAHLASQKAYTLSGGERRRVEIARVLVTSPSFILLDEPFTGVDPIAVADIQEIMSELRGKGFGILITDHNVRETLAITDRAYIMFEGKVVIAGTSDELATNEEARKMYLGEGFRL